MDTKQMIQYILDRYETRYGSGLKPNELGEYQEYLEDLSDHDLQNEINLFE